MWQGWPRYYDLMERSAGHSSWTGWEDGHRGGGVAGSLGDSWNESGGDPWYESDDSQFRTRSGDRGSSWNEHHDTCANSTDEGFWDLDGELTFQTTGLNKKKAAVEIPIKSDSHVRSLMPYCVSRGPMIFRQ